MAGNFKPDHAGIAAVLKSEGVAAVIASEARAVAVKVEQQGITVSNGEELPVVVDTFTTDRAAASVTLAHPAGRAVQAKYGVLTKAAAAVGLEVTER